MSWFEYKTVLNVISSNVSCKHTTHFVIGGEQGKSRHWRLVIGREGMTSL